MNKNKISFRLVSFFLVLLVLIGLFCQPCLAAKPKLPDIKYATDVCLYNLNSDKIIYKQSADEDEVLFPAAAVKMTTGLIACEMLSSRLEEKVLITAELLHGTEGATARLSPGMTVTVEELLLALLCGGGNDAAIVLSKLCADDTDAFVELMNTKAKEWGLRSTEFTNPTGMDDKKMTSTLTDVLILSKLAAKNETYVRLSSAPHFSYGDSDTKIFNRNSLISTYYADGYKNSAVKGLMCGNTDLGGYSVIAFAENGREQYICIVIGAQKKDGKIYSYEYVNSMLSYAFASFKYTKVLEAGESICYTDVAIASPDDGKETARVLCIVSQDAFALIPSDVDVEQLEYKYYLHYDSLEAPLVANTVVGGVDVIYDGEVIATSKLITKENVEPNSLLMFLENAKSFLGSRAVILCVSFVALGLLLYFYLFLLKRHRKTVKNINYKNFY